MRGVLTAQLLRLEAPRAVATCSRAWVSLSYRRLGPGRQSAGISTTCPAHKRPRLLTHARASLEDGADSNTVAIGQVMAAQANFVRVKVDAVEGSDGAAAAQPPPRTRLLCVVRGLLKKIKQSVLVGDQVRVVGIDWTDGRGMVEEVLPRRSELSDPSVANVDHVVLVFAADMPPFQPAQVTRYLVSAEGAGLPVTLVINKSDLVAAEDMQRIVDQVAGWGYRALPVSVASGQGLEALEERLQRRVSVVAGPSGAGKSSIINALRLQSLGLEGSLEAMSAAPSRSGSGSLEQQAEESKACSSSSSGGSGGSGSGGCDGGQLAHAAVQGRSEAAESAGALAAGGSAAAACATDPPSEQQEDSWSLSGSSSNTPGDLGAEGLELQAVGDISHRIGRGKHTTRNVTLLELGDGALLADTPGFNQPVLGMPAAELGQAFPEVRRLLQEGRCAFANCQHLAEPGCVVRDAGWERYGYYADLHAELTQREEVERERAASKKRREGTVRFKTRAGGRQAAEARLESKSHRRVSRRSVKQELSEIAKGLERDDEDEE